MARLNAEKPVSVRVVIGKADAPLIEVLRRGQRLIVQHPVAAQAMIRALVEEGDRFAQTPAGRRVRDDLARSELAARARIAWEGVTVNLLSTAEAGLVPTEIVDSILRAAREPELETLLAGLFVKTEGPQ